ncbi:ABC transporter substrate-binding protein [Paenibacillus allorhizosphaerae]|uniref:Extracellular solute-binding protein n=1 Tax=Paenibacillus allorhizosphaerae TaxID=2849866 RepID=A0ABN7TJC8_9BACL|nr:extracellular solute-binding protein [Paenibacillus allorhizosphaerae]CAG7637559.1 hypothetical protein PAECIP111802_02370 [Paenibacillus allorhizosphaerae]
MFKTISAGLMMTGIMVPILGCGGESVPNLTAVSAKDAPATITVYKSGLNLTDTEFQTFFVDPVQKKYPQYTLRLIADEKGATPEELLAAGTFPDIIFTSNPSYFRFLSLDVVQGLDDVIKKDAFDLSRIKPVITDSIRLYSGNQQLIALPFSLNTAALFYNKDVFDKFGMEYPREGLTWDEALKLGRQLTRTDNGTKYVGIDLTEPMNVARGLSLPLIDPKSGKAAVGSEAWVKVFRLLQESYEIPGYIGDNDRYSYGNKAFMQERNLAMLPNWLGGLIGPLHELAKQGNPLSWDVAPLPNFPEALGTGREIDIHSMMLSRLGAHQEQAWQVMSLMLQDEVQNIISRAGRQSVLDNPRLDEEFGKELDSLAGKQTANIFKTKPRLLHPPSEFDKDVAIKRMNEAAKDVAIGRVDVNTALRNAADNIDKDIASLKNTDRAQAGAK